MVISFKREILGLDGQPVKDDRGAALTLRTVAVNALLAVHADEQGLSGEEKLRRFKLAELIFGGGERVTLPLDDVAYVKRMIDRAYGPLVYGRAYAMLEGEGAKE